MQFGLYRIHLTKSSQLHNPAVATATTATSQMRVNSAEFPSLHDAGRLAGKGKMRTPAVPQVTRHHPWTVQDLESYTLFDKRFTKKNLLGRGRDGQVHSYVYNFDYDKVAVKTPYAITLKGNKTLAEEIENLKAVGKHDHIVGMLAFCKDFRPPGPAIMFPVCDLGDLIEYRDKWFEQQTAQGLSPHILEATILKLIHDISLGLNFLHNQSSKCYVHQSPTTSSSSYPQIPFEQFTPNLFSNH
jgi:hypothetical protein